MQHETAKIAKSSSSMRVKVLLCLLAAAPFASSTRIDAAPSAVSVMRAASAPLVLTSSGQLARGYPALGQLGGPAWMHEAAAPNNGTYVMFNSSNGGLGFYSGKEHTLTCTAPTLYNQEDGAVDSNHILWVAGGTIVPSYGVVALYGPGCGSPLEVITGLPGQAWDVAFDNRRNAYVELVLPPIVEVFAEHHLGPPATPATNLTDANAFTADGIAVDRSGNVFMAYDDATFGGHIAEFASGHGPALETGIATSGFQGSVAIDSAGNLLDLQYANQGNGMNVMYVYAPPYNPSTLLASIPLRAATVVCKFGKSGNRLYCVDDTNSTVDVYKYDSANPKNLSYLYSWHTYPASGLAPSPPFGY